MNTSKIILSTVVVVIALGLAGCKKKESGAMPPKETMGEMAKSLTSAEGIEQKTCPVSGDKIDPTVFVEYKGKKVYFCCASCKSIFDKDPEKYIAKLPQFAK